VLAGVEVLFTPCVHHGLLVHLDSACQSIGHILAVGPTLPLRVRSESCPRVQKQRIPEAVLAKIALMVLKGLFHLHKQMHIVHRDIKPANILLNMDGVAKIADFGISRNLDNTLDCCNTYKGTAVYMSPERLQSQPYGFASDIWSLGLCLVECATGKYPYDASGGPVTVMTYVRPSCLHHHPCLSTVGSYGLIDVFVSD
jgi:serine/threonine protein kinase